MKKLEYKVIVVYQPSQREEEENDRLRDLGLPVKGPSVEPEERQVRYSFRPTKVVDIRETFVNYKGGELRGVVVTFEGDGISYESPVLLTTYDQFEKDLEEYEQFNKEESEVK